MADDKWDASADPGPEETASGSRDRPIAPDDAQPGDRSELGANLGGPVDVFPGARRGGGVDHPTPGATPQPDEAGPVERPE